MKRKGCVHYMVDERDADILRVFGSLVKDVRLLRLHDVYSAVANSPAKRYWVTAKRAYDVCKAMQCGAVPGNHANPLRTEMYDSIYGQVTELQRQQPSLTMFEAVSKVVRRPAPKFYMSPMTIKNIVTSGIRRMQRERRERRLRCGFRS